MVRGHKGIRLIALLEAIKGTLVLFAGLGLFTMIHHNLQTIAEAIVWHFHLNPANHYPKIFIQLIGNITSQELWLLALFAFVYALARLIEAYGLWNAQRWAEWLAVISAALYLPFEFYELIQGISSIKIAMVATNAVIMIYMIFLVCQRQ